MSALVAWLAGHLAAEVTNPTGLFLLFAAGYLIAIGFSGIGWYFSLFQLYDVHGRLAANRLPLWPSLFVCILFVLGVGAGLWLFRQKDILH